jgi:hypothetical protein
MAMVSRGEPRNRLGGATRYERTRRKVFESMGGVSIPGHCNACENQPIGGERRKGTERSGGAVCPSGVETHGLAHHYKVARRRR